MSVAVRAAEALLDRGYGRPMKGMEFSDTKAHRHTTIEIVFVKPGERITSKCFAFRPLSCYNVIALDDERLSPDL